MVLKKEKKNLEGTLKEKHNTLASLHSKFKKITLNTEKHFRKVISEAENQNHQLFNRLETAKQKMRKLRHVWALRSEQQEASIQRLKEEVQFREKTVKEQQSQAHQWIAFEKHSKEEYEKLSQELKNVKELYAQNVQLAKRIPELENENTILSQKVEASLEECKQKQNTIYTQEKERKQLMLTLEAKEGECQEMISDKNFLMQKLSLKEA